MYRKYLLTSGAALTLAGLSILAAWGPLDPPNGPITPTYKTLSEVEPRIPVNAQTTPGDADTVFEITKPGSYYLTGNVTGVSGKNGITISASGVTLDLGGFVVQGVEGALRGVWLFNGTNNTVRNGTVSGWEYGVLGGVESRFENIAANSNTTGISVGEVSISTGCTASGNGTGFRVGSGSSVRDSIASRNTSEGFSAASATLTGCSAYLNKDVGYSVGSGTVLSDCSAAGNSAAGFSLTSASRASRCSSDGNGGGFRLADSSAIVECSATNNDVDGALVTGDANTVERCTLVKNARHGLYVISGRGNNLDGNQCMFNGNVGVRSTSPDNLFVRNRSRGNPGGDYGIDAGSDYGVILTNPGQGFSSSAAWANFAY